MEIDLHRDDGIVHVITTGTSFVDGILWVSTYFGMSRYDGRYWRGLYAHETGLPSDFGNAVKGRSNNEGWFATDRGLGVCADFETDTWVTYTRSDDGKSGTAVVARGTEGLQTIVFVMSDLDLGMNDGMSPPLEWDDNYEMNRGKVLECFAGRNGCFGASHGHGHHVVKIGAEYADFIGQKGREGFEPLVELADL